MFRAPMLVLGFVILLAGCKSSSDTSPQPGTPPSPDTYKPLVEGNTAFAIDLYGKLRTTDGNMIVSPLSASTALAMSYAGAKGDTETQMARALHFTLPQDKLHPAFRALKRDVFGAGEKKGGVQIKSANALFAQKGVQWKAGYRETVTANYGGGLQDVDFKADHEAARKQVNDWASKETGGLIPELIPQGVLTHLTRLILTDAVYFKGEWDGGFNKAHTREGQFSVSTKDTVKVPLMQRAGEHMMYEGEKFDALELPYKGKQISMVILLPHERDGLAELEKALTPKMLDTAIQGLTVREKVNVVLPRFKVEYGRDLKDPLRGLGMSDAFDEKAANFSGQAGEPGDLHIEHVLHKAFIEVNEEGTEAAAATAVIEVAKSAEGGPREQIYYFRADHPFLFFIRDVKSNSILFLGRVVNPAK